MEAAPRTIRAAECVVMPWKNGQGTTTELVVEPPGASLDDFAWRLSIAELRGSGPFSRFPGHDRVIVQLDGPPMTLTHGELPPVELELHVPHSFSGDDETTCAVAGVAHDFNLIVRHGVARAMLTMHRLGRGEQLVCEAGDVAILYILEGGLTDVGGLKLHTGDTRVATVAQLSPHTAPSGAVVLLTTLTWYR